MTFITAENLLQEKSAFMGYEATAKLRKLANVAIDFPTQNPSLRTGWPIFMRKHAAISSFMELKE